MNAWTIGFQKESTHFLHSAQFMQHCAVMIVFSDHFYIYCLPFAAIQNQWIVIGGICAPSANKPLFTVAAKKFNCIRGEPTDCARRILAARIFAFDNAHNTTIERHKRNHIETFRGEYFNSFWQDNWCGARPLNSLNSNSISRVCWWVLRHLNLPPAHRHFRKNPIQRMGCTRTGAFSAINWKQIALVNK